MKEEHTNFAPLQTDVTQYPEQIPAWLTEVTNYLLLNTVLTENPNNHRPMKSLSINHKIVISILTERKYSLLAEKSTFHEFKNVVKGILMGEKTNYSQIKKKAFDLVSHNRLLKALVIYKITSVLSNFLQLCMVKWNTRLGNHSYGVSQFNNLNIERCIFKGNSLCPSLFCMALLIPLPKKVTPYMCTKYIILP